ncbi:major facilitator superfamily transporter [Histomonas meleagridis]|uniref:major facilitator superfamily transporter n=1 Tax=Histomonas meleagridis TaxID=135588 RepID=UPI003559B6EC|nr:major facilitator superfamily transporter [Histomonas meleagridis]KAH0802283.1 major facilitator superfamily transporter [Histomonas meleagridis]
METKSDEPSDVAEKEANPSSAEYPFAFHLRKWSGFVFCCCCYMLVHFHRYCPSVLADEMAPALGVPTSKLGIFSSMYFWSYAIMQPIVGCFSDLIEPGYILGVSGIISAIGSLICGLSKSFTLSSIARFFVGLGCSCPYCATARFMANWWTPTKFYTMTSILFCIGGIGGIISQKPLIALGQAIGWRWSLISISIFGFVFSICAFIFVRSSPVYYGFNAVQGTSRPPPHRSLPSMLKTVGLNLLEICKIPKFWIHSVAIFFSVSTFQNLSGMWAVPYLTDVYGYTSSEAGTITLSLMVVMIVGSPFLGFISVRFHMTKWLEVICIAFSIVIEIIFVIWTDKIPEWALYVLFFLFGVSTTSTQSFTLPMYKDMVKPELAASVSGCGNMFIFLGAAVMQNITSAILSTYGVQPYPTEGYRGALWGFSLGSSCVALIAAIVLPTKKKEKEENNVEEEEEEEEGHEAHLQEM